MERGDWAVCTRPALTTSVTSSAGEGEGLMSPAVTVDFPLKFPCSQGCPGGGNTVVRQETCPVPAAYQDATFSRRVVVKPQGVEQDPSAYRLSVTASAVSFDTSNYY